MNRNLKFSLFAVLPLFLVGCATAKIVKGRDGTNHYLLKCIDPMFCYERAEGLCNGLYSVVSVDDRVDTVIAKVEVKCSHKTKL
jgi:hypothetical protein